MRAEALSRRLAFLAFAITFLVLIGNGRAIGSGDTNAAEKTAGALATRGTVILEDDGAADAFTRAVPGGRVSIYPVLPALMAAPLFFIFGLFFDLNLTGLQIAGKLFAALLCATATAGLAWSFSKRATPAMALGSALLFGLGTSVFSTAQALWQHPAVLLFLVIAISAMERTHARAGLIAAICLSLAAAARPATIPMDAVLFVFLVCRQRAQEGRLILAAGIPAALVAVYNTWMFGAPWRFGPGLGGRFWAAFPESVAGLLVSPGRGLLVFTPLAILAALSLMREARSGILARGLIAAVLTHFSFMALWNEWHGGESFGPRLLTDMLPALFFYLPEALTRWPRAGAALGALSVSVQLLGGWTYDYRWERLHQRGLEFDSALWSWRDSPIAFALREGVVIQGAPEFVGRRARLTLRRSVPLGPQGAIIEGTPEGLRLSGPPLVRDLRLERGGRINDGWITLSHPADAVAFRILSNSVREVRLTGSLQGTIRIETGQGVLSTPLAGAFDIAFPIQPAMGDDILVRAESGELRLARVQIR